MAAARLRTHVLNAKLLHLVPGAVFIALAGLAIPLTVHASADDRRTSARQAAVAAATGEVDVLVNISFRTAQRDLDRIVAGATGHLATLFATQRAQVQLLANSQSVTRGSVLSAGLTRLDLAHGIARVDVAADASVSDQQHPQPVVKHYRWVLTLQLRHGRWLVSDAALAGVPQ